MSEPSESESVQARAAQVSSGENEHRYWLHILLFLVTVLTTTYAGYVLVGRLLVYAEAEQVAVFNLVTINTAGLMDGLRYAVPLLFFLTVHEFGHFFAARYHRIRTSLPYYIPFILPIFPNIGTFGAVIRIREPVPSERKLFDIGAAGPLAGFVIALGALIYALVTLPGPEYVLDMPGHEAMKEYIKRTGQFPDAPLTDTGEGEIRLYVGYTPLFWLLTELFPNVPPMYEVHHYPVLFAGWLGLFFTALNLLPVGQLDGGHILYALVGRKWHGRLARSFVVLLLISGAVGLLKDLAPTMANYPFWGPIGGWALLAGILYLFLRKVYRSPRNLMLALGGILAITGVVRAVGPALAQYGYTGWLVWCLLLVFVIKVDHPPVLYREPLTPRRRLAGIVSMIIFILCFSLRPVYVG